MKKPFSYFVLVCLCILAGCVLENDDNPYFTPFYGHAKMDINGTLLDIAPYAHTTNHIDSTFSLTLAYLNKNFFLRGALYIINIPKSIGIHTIIRGTGEVNIDLDAQYGSYLSHGDVVGDLFQYDSSLMHSYLQIDRYDSSNREVEGSFKVQLLRASDHISSPELSDTLYIEGTFLTRID